MSELRIYVACLAAYNEGYLHGAWIDATQEPEEIMAEVRAMLAESPCVRAEEWAIHDYDGFAGLGLGEWESFEHVHELALFIEEHGEIGRALLERYDLEEAREKMEDAYAGCYSSLGDYAAQLTEETSEIPKHLEHYIDYEAMERDWELSGDIERLEISYDEVHIFWNH